MKNFRLNLKESHEALKNSICEIQNPSVRSAVRSMTENQVIGGSKEAGWLKAHGDVTWEKATAMSL